MSNTTTCPTCGSKVQVSEGTTKHFIPVDASQVSLAFAEWKEDNAPYGSDGLYYVESLEGPICCTLEYLYQYWIEKVYNK